MKLPTSLARIANAAGPTLHRFWVPVALTVAVTTTLIIATTIDFHSNHDLIRTALALVSGVLTAWCSILFWEREARQTRVDPQLAGNLIAIPAAGLVAALVYAMLGMLNIISLSRYVAISLFLFLAFFVIPHFRKEGSLEMYVVRLFSHAVVCILFSAVMYTGLSGITFTISALFGLTVTFTTYVRIWLVMFGVMAPFLFMAGIPKGTVASDTEDYPKVLKNLVLFVVTPVLAAYTLVLYGYFAKILISRQWPVGLVAHLVLWYSLLSTAVLFFVWPVSKANKWGNAFSQYFPRAVIPLLLMMFASVGIRIRYYGITENRYYVLALGLWVFGCMVYLTFTSAKRSLVLPASLALVVILSVFGPWSSFAVSKWSQNRRLEALLTKYGMLEGNVIVPATQAVPLSDRWEIAEILFYFDSNHKLSDVRVLPRDFKIAEFHKVFGFEYSDSVSTKPRQYVRYEAEDQCMDISGYQYLFDYTRAGYGSRPMITLTQGRVSVTYEREGHKVMVTLDGNLEWELSLLEYLSGLEPKYDGEMPGFSPEDMVLDAESVNLRVKVVITAVEGQFIGLNSGETHINRLEFYLLAGER